jgi:beta-galactosidase
MEIEVQNRNFFTNTNALKHGGIWRKTEFRLLQGNWSGCRTGRKKIYVLPIQKPQIKAGATYLVTVSFHTKEATQWAPKGFELCWDQLELPWIVPADEKLAQHPTNPLKLTENEQQLIVSGVNFDYTFNKANGQLYSMKYMGTELLKQGGQLNVWRAPVANELDDWTNPSVSISPRTEATEGWLPMHGNPSSG